MADFRTPGQSDESIILTNDEASCSKKYAISLNYWSDPYINHMCKQSHVRKTPEISRGYFGRVFAVRCLVEQFIKAHKGKCQVISLGAGYDTLFWNLHSAGLLPLKYVELDFNTVTRAKNAIIHTKREQLLKPLGENVEILGSRLGCYSSCYSLLPADLRNVSNLDSQLRLDKVGLDFSLPTLFLAECVLMYIPQKECDQLLHFLSQSFTDSHFVNYDVVNMSDRFAEVMLSNLDSRQCTLHIQDCQTEQTQIDRFQRVGWKHCIVKNMDDIYKSIDSSERLRVEKIEMLDEVHLLSELMMHYCICVASNTDNIQLTLDNLNTSIGR